MNPSRGPISDRTLQLAVMIVLVGVSGLVMAGLVALLPMPYGVMLAMAVWLAGLAVVASGLQRVRSRAIGRLTVGFQAAHAAAWMLAVLAAHWWPGWPPAIWISGAVMTLAGLVGGHLVFHASARPVGADASR